MLGEDGCPFLGSHLIVGGQPHETHRGHPIQGNIGRPPNRELDVHAAERDAQKMGAHTEEDACKNTPGHTRYFLDDFFTSTDVKKS